MKSTKKRWSLLSAVCLLLSLLLIASSCVALDPNNEPTVSEQQTTGGNDKTPNQNGGNDDNTPSADPNKVQFSITLKDAEGYAWEGVRVQICEKGDSGKCSTPATTNDQGSAVITIDKTVFDLNNSAIKIVKATGYVTTTAPIEIIPGETSKTIHLSEYVVKTDNFGQGVEGVFATVSLDGTAVATGKTDATGGVKFLLETDDDYVVTVVSPQGATLLDTVNTSWKFGENSSITLSYLVVNLVDKTVTVVDENAQPVANATVKLISTAQEKDEFGNYLPAYIGTTDATGKVVFEGLNASSRYYVVVNDTAIIVEGENVWLDMGMTELTVSCSTTVAANATYTVKVGYYENETFVVMEGSYVIVLVVYNDDLEQEELARYTTVNGVVTFERPEEIFYAVIDGESIPEGYRTAFNIPTGFFDKVAEIELEEIPESVPGDSSENPLEWNTTHHMTGMPTETTQILSGLTQEQQVWYQLTLSAGMELLVQTNTPGAIVCVSYNGRVLETVDGTLLLVFDETTPKQQQALIGVYLGGRTYTADVTLTVRVAGSAGGNTGNNNLDNLSGSGTDRDPFVLTEGGTYTAVVTTSNSFTAPVIYQITIAANGTLEVTGLGDNHWISLACVQKSFQSDATNPTENNNKISQSVNAGEVWTIIVGTYNDQADEVQFTVALS